MSTHVPARLGRALEGGSSTHRHFKDGHEALLFPAALRSVHPRDAIAVLHCPGVTHVPPQRLSQRGRVRLTHVRHVVVDLIRHVQLLPRFNARRLVLWLQLFVEKGRHGGSGQQTTDTDVLSHKISSCLH
eukprot:2270438-Rhodomonas_salina.1